MHACMSIQAICFTAFLIGFITVLCIGNYFRAKRAQERQRQRRLAKIANAGGGAEPAYAPDSYAPGGGYEAPQHMPAQASAGVQA